MWGKNHLIDSLQATTGNWKNASDRCDVDQYLKGHISIKPGPSHTLVIHHGKFLWEWIGCCSEWEEESRAHSHISRG